MNESKHTPGPWEARKTGMGGSHIYAGNTIPALVYSIAGGQQQAEANARLIAAAPELLEALQYLCDVSHTDPRGWDQARAAIAKATGGAS